MNTFHGTHQNQENHGHLRKKKKRKRKLLKQKRQKQQKEKLKNKLLTYSVPRVNNDDIEFVDVRFFPNEASDMIWQLLLRAEKNDNVEDYYGKLIENREQKQ